MTLASDQGASQEASPQTRDQAVSWMAETATGWGWTAADMEQADRYFSAQIGVSPSSEVADRMREQAETGGPEAGG